jgi:hypothetical protein
LLVYTEFESDERGVALGSDVVGAHPNSTEVRVEIATVGDGARMVLTHLGIPAESPGALGWQMALGKLARSLA